MLMTWPFRAAFAPTTADEARDSRLRELESRMNEFIAAKEHSGSDDLLANVRDSRDRIRSERTDRAT